jgi:hypothetical protein
LKLETWTVKNQMIFESWNLNWKFNWNLKFQLNSTFKFDTTGENVLDTSE